MPICRTLIHDALDWLEHWRDRVRCRTRGIHGKTCRGRQDHTTRDGRLAAGPWR